MIRWECSRGLGVGMRGDFSSPHTLLLILPIPRLSGRVKKFRSCVSGACYYAIAAAWEGVTAQICPVPIILVKQPEITRCVLSWQAICSSLFQVSTPYRAASGALSESTISGVEPVTTIEISRRCRRARVVERRSIEDIAFPGMDIGQGWI